MVSPDWCNAFILAESKDEAILKYKDRYNWNNYDRVLDGLWGGLIDQFPCLNKKNPGFEYDVLAHESYPTLERLKKELKVDEFFSYCRQELYPVEVVLSNITG